MRWVGGRLPNAAEAGASESDARAKGVAVGETRRASVEEKKGGGGHGVGGLAVG